MSPLHKARNIAERYDQALLWARDRHLPPEAPRPQRTAAWPEENVRLLERYAAWLASGGTSPPTIGMLYVPMAGHVLGLALKPHRELDLTTDLERAMAYVRAKRLSAEWTDMCRNALNKFQRFLRQVRGSAEADMHPCNVERYRLGLPDWLCRELERYQHVMQSHWRPARVNQQTLRFWSAHTRLWRWLIQRYRVSELHEIKRKHLLAYVDERLAAGGAASTVNADLRYWRAFLLFLQDNDYPVPQALLRVPSLKQPDALPRFLTDEQVRLLRDDLERRVQEARSIVSRRDALFDRAAFYLLWQAGLRLGEAEELRLEDLDLAAGRLMVRQGKGQKDRTVYLTGTLVRALTEYLTVRGEGATDHVFLCRNMPVHKDLLRSRIQAAGVRAGVKVHPHRLRPTCATQLVNAGCRITTIQKFLGHEELNSTMIYARVHDRTAADDYYRAMAQVEKRLDLNREPAPVGAALGPAERSRLLHLVRCLAEPQLDLEGRLHLVYEMRAVLVGTPCREIGPPLAV